MAEMTFLEKRKFETILGMSGGYVLDFSNRTFRDFVYDSVGKDIYEDRYSTEGESKARRLRSFWQEEPDHVVGKLLDDLLAYWSEMLTRSPSKEDLDLFQECRDIAERLSSGAFLPDIEAISPTAGGKEFEILARHVRQSIERDEPEAALDRLHTFIVKYVRTLIGKHNLGDPEGKPLHSLFGEYVKYLKNAGRIESEMAERILKFTISTMDAFNAVRNQHSLAHDNLILGRDESLLIFNHVASAVRFIGALEDQRPPTR